jgi:heme/copper-type cytochrome/quinol oxidase subunit 2
MVFNIPLFPDTASTLASQVDYLFYFILAVNLFFCGAVFAGLAYFSVR